MIKALLVALDPRAFISQTAHYPDAAEKLHDWHGRGLRLYVHCSKPAAEQESLLRESVRGDLTRLFSGYFDTRAGVLSEPATYRRITDAVATAATEILMLSDSADRLDAAQRAGFATRWLVRDSQPDPAASHVQIRRFAEAGWILG